MLTASAIFDGSANHAFVLPPARDQCIDAVLRVRAHGEDLRVERVTFGTTTLLRLLRRDANGNESASNWTSVDPGARLSIGIVRVGDTTHALLEGAQAPLELDAGAR